MNDKVIYRGRAPGNGAMLATAGDLVFWGDLDGKLRAFDAASGKTLWETALPGTVQNSTITYAVNGKQYLAVFTGVGSSDTKPEVAGVGAAAGEGFPCPPLSPTPTLSPGVALPIAPGPPSACSAAIPSSPGDSKSLIRRRSDNL